MNVALVIERMDPMRGGRERSVAQIATELARRGVDVTILCQDATFVAEGVEIVPLGRRGFRRKTELRNFAVDCTRVAAERGFDVVHATLPVPCANVYQLRGGTIPGQVAAARWRRGPLGRALHAVFEPLNTHRRLMAAMERNLMARPGVMVLPVSELIAGEIERYYGVHDNVRVIYNAVDVPDRDDPQYQAARAKVRKTLRAREGHPVFVTLATNFELKGVQQLIDAFARFHSRHYKQWDAKLLVVGRDPVEAEEYLKYAEGRHVAGRVAFIPRAEDPFHWLAAADVCVLLSWYDPCSRVVLEATRWRLPSITTAYNGAGEVLRDGAGVVVDSPRDIEGIVAAMERLADPDARAAAAEACDAVADGLSMARHVEKLQNVYQEVSGR